MHQGQIAAFFCLASLPPKVGSITLDFNFRVLELEHSGLTVNACQHSYNMDSYWRGIYAQTAQLQSLQTLTFQLDIKKFSYCLQDSSTVHAPLEPIRQLQSETFLWDAADDNSLKEIQQAPNVYGYASPIFTSKNGIKWFMTFYANGSKMERKGCPNVYLHLAALPRCDIKINIRHSQGLNGDTLMRDARFYTVFDLDRSSWGLIEKSTYSTKDLMHLKSFLCVAEVTILDVYQQDDRVPLSQFEQNAKNECFPLKRSDYEWTLDGLQLNGLCDRPKTSVFVSELFELLGMKWSASLYPFGKEGELEDITIGLQLMEGIADYTMSVRLYFEIVELQKRYITTGIFDKQCTDIDWGDGRVLTEDIDKLGACTIRIGMELIDVYAADVCVTREYLHCLNE